MTVTTEPQPVKLSHREKEVLRAWLSHDSKSAAAKHLFVSQSTVNTHIVRIRNKYRDAGRGNPNTKAALMILALRDGIIEFHELPQ